VRPQDEQLRPFRNVAPALSSVLRNALPPKARRRSAALLLL
jgi:hypothetical protein